uniref:Uncharacterized protein n=1 Tax=uncultured bacterium A1Q1_fos_499 TaxID=1256578 RepID=L7VTL4_9BACT|nr:hypothetical protein [uncultured bacterium A1Q1_fos_499]
MDLLLPPCDRSGQGIRSCRGFRFFRLQRRRQHRKRYEEGRPEPGQGGRRREHAPFTQSRAKSSRRRSEVAMERLAGPTIGLPSCAVVSESALRSPKRGRLSRARRRRSGRRG